MFKEFYTFKAKVAIVCSEIAKEKQNYEKFNSVSSGNYTELNKCCSDAAYYLELSIPKFMMEENVKEELESRGLIKLWNSNNISISSNSITNYANRIKSTNSATEQYLNLFKLLAATYLVASVRVTPLSGLNEFTASVLEATGYDTWNFSKFREPAVRTALECFEEYFGNLNWDAYAAELG